MHVGFQGSLDVFVLVDLAVLKIDVVLDEIPIELEGLILEIPLL